MNEPLIKITGLCKSYKQHQALKGLDLNVMAGEVLAFLGPNGAGKTTTINILTGLLQLDAGEVCYDGVLFNPENLSQKRVMGVVPQHNNLDRDLTVARNLKVHGLLFGMRGKILVKRIYEVLELVDMLDLFDRPAGKLSGGQKRRLIIARALLHNPKILFLDEPSTGLDVEARRTLHKIIAGLKAKAGVSVFLTTHYIEEADLLADRVAFIESGQIVALGNPDELKSSIGRYALECYDDGEFLTLYFNNREAAVNAAGVRTEEVRIREVTLEDVYLKYTGKKMGCANV